MKTFIRGLVGAFVLMLSDIAMAADVVPDAVKMPGTQPGDIGNLESPNRCDNCHGGYNTAVEPAFNWRGSMMAHAGRDPIFWATLAIAEQDFDGAGDLCIRCHSTAGWLGGRSTPTDGSGLAAGDSDGVECDFCHKMTNPDNTEHPGVMYPGFVANEPSDSDPDGTEGYLGSGMSSLWGGSDKLGPYSFAPGETEPKHQYMHSQFHRDPDFCGTCHDVSNPVVGHLAPNHGTQDNADAVNTGSTNPANAPNPHAAFNNPPYKYGIVERTFSEYKAGQVSATRVSDYPNLPDDLKAGALEAVYNAATQNGTISPNYQNPPMDRYFSCQTCHMRPVEGKGANKSGLLVRKDLPLHDMTGGNYWMGEAIKYLDRHGKLRLGGGLTAEQISAIDAGALRAKEQLELAASLSVNGNTVKIVNHTGHKLISGYPEGRRMWLNVKWYDGNNTLLREDGAYGKLVDEQGNPVMVTNPNPPDPQEPLVQVESILDLEDPNTKLYEAHMGITQDWAERLLSLGPPYDNMVLGYDRETGAPEETLAHLAAEPDGSYEETFHFVLNNAVVKDNRIPPYGMRYDLAKERNALPVPANQYDGSPGSTYNYWDEVTLNPPQGAVYADIQLLYQPTSWEYIQFLYLANNKTNAFLADEGVNMLDAWLNTGMAAPHVMASATWGTPPDTPPAGCDVEVPTMLSATAGSNGEIITTWEIQGNPDILDYRLYYDQSGKAQFIVEKTCAAGDCTHTDMGLTNGQEYCYKVTTYTTTCESGFSNILCTTATQPGLITTVPDVVGQLRSEAETAISDAGLVVAQPVGTDYSDTVFKDHVISQQPAGGTEVQQGSEVNIVLSLGPAGAVDCSQIPDKSSCNSEPLCEWQGSPKNGMCVDVAICEPTEPDVELSCTDGLDNDCDGALDCADGDCTGDPACQQVDCSIHDETACVADPACRWHKKQGCIAL